MAGEGQYLSIFNHQNSQLVYTQKVFEEQAIHGIASSSFQNTDGVRNGTLLIWGGRSICVFGFNAKRDIYGKFNAQLSARLPEIRADDRILDGCFQDIGSDEPRPQTNYYFKPVLLTAHNELLQLNTLPDGSPDLDKPRFLHRIASGPSSILYSAHIVWPASERILVAAGTVFGDVLLWSLPFQDSDFSGSVSVHCTFKGHEGSVFGVRISERVENGLIQRILASCSDDRTIRVWDISNAVISDTDVRIPRFNRSLSNVSKQDSKEAVGCLATAMGHASRIWGLRFLGRYENIWQLLSYGEDGTTQVWRLSPTPHQEHSTGGHFRYGLEHLTTYAYHTGKNLWAVAVQREAIATGGADGRITSYQHHLKGESPNFGTSICHCTIKEAVASSKTAANSYDHDSTQQIGLPKVRTKTIAQRMFDGLAGCWKLSRQTRSQISTNLSGSLDGIATFSRRAPSDKGYDAEYFYSENGDFVSDKGLIFKANRHYVYRYQESKDIISAWFVKDESTVDYFFHNLNFGDESAESLQRPEDDKELKLKASGHHLCVNDTYQPEYSFKLDNSTGLNRWSLRYIVKGPGKDDVIDNNYTRDEGSGGLGPAKPISGTTNISDSLPTANESPAEVDDSFKIYAWIGNNSFLTSTEHGNLLVGTMDSNGRHGKEKRILANASGNSPRKANNETFKASENMGSKGTELLEEVDSQASRATEKVPQRKIESSTAVIDAVPSDVSCLTWEKVGHETQLESSCIATSVPSLGIALLTGTDGTIHLYNNRNRTTEVVKELGGKASFLKAQHLKGWNPGGLPKPKSVTVGVLAACLGSSSLTAFTICLEKGNSDVKLEEICLGNLPSNFLVTSSCFIEKAGSLILGSRNGHIIVAVFPAQRNANNDNIPIWDDSDEKAAFDYLLQVHGEEAVTCIEPFGVANSGSTFSLATTGRDGRYAVHKVAISISKDGSHQVELQTVHTGVPPFGPNIEGLCFDQTTKCLFVWGFRSQEFVVWNEVHKSEVMTVKCGGAHRNWSYCHRCDGRGGGSLVWTKAKVCSVHSQAKASHQVLRCGGHGREIKAIAVREQTFEGVGKIIATGAEDTTIRIFQHVPEKGFHCASISEKHTTGLQKLQWSLDGTLLFSAASCEEFFVWKVTMMSSSPCLQTGVVCVSQCPPVTESGHLRIMDFALTELPHGDQERKYLLTMVYSDSSIRMFRYDAFRRQGHFELLRAGSYATSCLTQALNLEFGSLVHPYATSTDGNIVLWSPSDRNTMLSPAEIFDFPLILPPDLVDTSGTGIPLEARFPIHQSSIKSLICPHPPRPLSLTSTCGHIIIHPHFSNIILTTGGDDGAIAFTRVILPHSPFIKEVPTHTTLYIPNAHASAVNAITCISTAGSGVYLFASVGNDQRLKTWRFSIDWGQEGVNGARVVRDGNVYTSVADASSLGSGTDKYGQRRVYVAGIGMESWKVNDLRMVF